MTLEKINDVSIDRIVANQIPYIRNEVLHKDKDKHLLIDGREGSGKSLLGMQLAKVLDLEFNIDKIAFNSDEFIKMVKSPERKKGDCILLDEAFSSANARASLSQINRAMITVATEMRQLNLFIIIILPTYFDLDKYFAIWRSDTLFHVFFDKDGNRGSYTIYPFEDKLTLYINGKKTYNYHSWQSPYPPCKFLNQWVVDEVEYRKRKAAAFRARKTTVYGKLWKDRSCKLMIWLHDKEDYKYEEIADILGIKVENVMETLEKWRKFGSNHQNILNITTTNQMEDDEDEDSSG